MKTKFCIICFLLAFVTCNTIAQMPNGNFNFTCANPGSSGIFYDAFRYNTPGTGNCGLDPWAVSHGTPDIEKFNSAQVPFSYHFSAESRLGLCGILSVVNQLTHQ